MGNIFANDTSDKGLISKIYKELTRMHSRKTHNPIKKKVGKGLEQTLLQEDIQRAQRHMNRCLASQAMRELQIKTTMRYHLRPVTVTNISKSTKKCWRGCGEKGTIVYCWWECRLLRPLWKTVWNFLGKLKKELPVGLAISLLGL